MLQIYTFINYQLFYRKYPEISSIDHLWVARVWIKDLGLNQYSSAFESQMIDGRLLNVLTKKDMEKYLNVNKKFHQVRNYYSEPKEILTVCRG